MRVVQQISESSGTAELQVSAASVALLCHEPRPLAQWCPTSQRRWRSPKFSLRRCSIGSGSQDCTWPQRRDCSQTMSHFGRAPQPRARVKRDRDEVQLVVNAQECPAQQPRNRRRSFEPALQWRYQSAFEMWLVARQAARARRCLGPRDHEDYQQAFRILYTEEVSPSLGRAVGGAGRASRRGWFGRMVSAAAADSALFWGEHVDVLVCFAVRGILIGAGLFWR